MIYEINPYTPGSGRKPGYFAGRDDIIREACRCIKSTKSGYPERSIAYYGLRGVGKTVILNEIENEANKLGVLYSFIEINENNSFVEDISSACQNFLLDMSLAENFKDKGKRLIEVIKRFQISWDIEDKSVSLGLSDFDFVKNKPQNFVNLFVELGRLAKDTGNTICFFIDEIQYIKEEHLSALLMALHRANQLGLPLLIFCAGLPKIIRTFAEVKSYAERLFLYVPIASLTEAAAKDAIRIPAGQFDVDYSSDAIDRILEVTECYPYFIQELCSTIWQECIGSAIHYKNVLDSESKATENLDNGFFASRYDKCTEREKEFMHAMVKCGELPCTIANVAAIMGRTVKSISPFRGSLINKGLIYSTAHAEIDFTVPQFDEFLKRKVPEIQKYLDDIYS